jgi:hypothetical protein
MNRNSKNGLSILFHATGVFVVGLVVTLLFQTFLPAAYRQNESTDYLFYYEPVARQIINGAGITLPNGEPAITNPPGYPILLAAVFLVSHNFGMPADLAQTGFVLACMGFSAMFIFLLSEEIWQDSRGGWLSAIFFMSYPFVLWLTKQPASEVPFMTAFYASLYFFWLSLKAGKNVWFLLLIAGTFAGAAMLIRAIAIGIGVVLFGFFLVLRKNILIKERMLLASLILVGNMFVVLPWQAWLYGQTGRVILLGTNSVPSMRDGLTFAVASKNYRREIEIPEDVSRLQNSFLDETTSMTSLEEIGQTIQKHFKQEPGAVINLFLIKMIRSWYGTDSGNMEKGIVITQIFYAGVVLLATAVVWVNREKQPWLLFFVWGLVFYFWMMTTLVLSILRYMTPTVGLLSLIIPGIRFAWARRGCIPNPS